MNLYRVNYSVPVATPEHRVAMVVTDSVKRAVELVEGVTKEFTAVEITEVEKQVTTDDRKKIMVDPDLEIDKNGGIDWK